MSTPELHLSRIDLIAFRGIERTLRLDFGRRLTIIYGGNATGKSSVAQGIEFAISGQVRDYEDGLIPAAYLANTRAAGTGRVSLTLDDGVVLSSATDQPRTDIERRFREIGAVDWPDRQPLPFTTTHVTSQGMLTRVLGSSNVVTRNDLSGLCAGAYLRFLVSRASRLADYFRQASSGRNIQSELGDARAMYDTAKLLCDSLLTTGQTAGMSSAAISTKLRELNTSLSLPEPTSVEEAWAHLEGGLQKADQKLRIFQRLLGRTRELGQHEAELIELGSQLEEAQKTRSDLLDKKAAENALLVQAAEGVTEAVSRRSDLLDAMAAYERHQQSVSAITALEERLQELSANEQRIKDGIQALRQQLDSARSDLIARSTKLAQMRQSRQFAEVHRNAIQQALSGISALPRDHDPELETTLATLRRELADLDRSAVVVSNSLQEARQEEALISARLLEISNSGERFLAASSEMTSFMTDSHCPLCGVDHGTVEALDRAIRHVSAAALEGAVMLRPQYEAALNRRQAAESRKLEHDSRVADRLAQSSAIASSIDRKIEERRTAISSLEDTLRRAGVSIPLETMALRHGLAAAEATISGLDQEIRDESAAEREEENRRSQFERTLAARVSEAEQSDRLAAELSDQIARVRAGLGPGTSAEEVAKKRAELVGIEPQVKTLEREHGQAQARLSELDRAIAEKTSEIAGIDRRLQVVQVFLDSLDAELKTVGATRNVRDILEMEQGIREEREELVVSQNSASEIKQNMRILEQNRALSNAQEQLAAAEQSLRSVQNRQQRLQERGLQLKNLHQHLEILQNDTAELVLQNIRRPVGTLFHAMTAGCPWDIEFRLEDGKVNAVLTDGFARDVTATSVLNSAYVNVAAIALRLALASQQRWTRLRTVVLDDPILEMDHLTQSALIDGLEAILSSTFSPWQDLQFVLTTWSEDFAVMAAHKLAHLNHDEGKSGDTRIGSIDDDFIIHRLSSDSDGTIVSQRHVPRWQAEASVA
jgi:DNA repair exonuclease SbcCD ATPase subunit